MKKGTIFKKALLDDRQAYLNIKEGRLNEWEASLVAREAHLALHSGQQGTSETGVAVKQEEDVFEEKPAMSSGGEGKKRASRAKQVRKFKSSHGVGKPKAVKAPSATEKKAINVKERKTVKAEPSAESMVKEMETVVMAGDDHHSLAINPPLMKEGQQASTDESVGGEEETAPEPQPETATTIVEAPATGKKGIKRKPSTATVAKRTRAEDSRAPKITTGYHVYLAENKARISEKTPNDMPKRGMAIRIQAGNEWRQAGKEEKERYESLAKVRSADLVKIWSDLGLAKGLEERAGALEKGTEELGDELLQHSSMSMDEGEIEEEEQQWEELGDTQALVGQMMDTEDVDSEDEAFLNSRDEE